MPLASTTASSYCSTAPYGAAACSHLQKYRHLLHPGAGGGAKKRGSGGGSGGKKRSAGNMRAPRTGASSAATSDGEGDDGGIDGGRGWMEEGDDHGGKWATPLLSPAPLPCLGDPPAPPLPDVGAGHFAAAASGLPGWACEPDLMDAVDAELAATLAPAELAASLARAGSLTDSEVLLDMLLCGGQGERALLKMHPCVWLPVLVSPPPPAMASWAARRSAPTDALCTNQLIGRLVATLCVLCRRRLWRAACQPGAA